MAKKILVREGVIDSLRSLFFTAKASGKEDDIYDRLVQTNPEVAREWERLDNAIEKELIQTYKTLKAYGVDTTDIEADLKKRGIKYK